MNLKEIRRSRGYSLRIMAQVLDIPKNTYVKYEKGTRKIPEALKSKIRERLYFKAAASTVLQASFDWVSLHFRSYEVEKIVQKLLGVPLTEFSLEEYTRYRYTAFYRYGAINLYVDDKDMAHGVLLELSGIACREVEKLLKEQERDWRDFFNDCLLLGQEFLESYDLPVQEDATKVQKIPKFFNVTRLDLALDEFYSEEGNYDLFKLFERFHEGLVLTPKRSYSSQMGGKFTKEGLINDGLTLYLGTGHSSPFFRFYEKDAERAKAMGISIDSVHDLYGFKNRLEIVLRSDKADQFIRDYVANHFQIAEQAVRIINANLVVFSDFQGHLDEDWYTLMNSHEAYHFKTTPKELDVTKTWAWAEKAVFPTMAFLKVDDEQKFYDFLGDAKISKRYENYLLRKQKKKNANKKS